MKKIPLLFMAGLIVVFFNVSIVVADSHTSTVSYTTSLTCPPIHYTNVYTVKNDANSANNIKQFKFIRPAAMNVVSVTAPTGWTGSFDTSTAIVTFTTSGSGISPGNSVSGFKVEYTGTAFDSHGVNTFDSTGDSYHAIAQRDGGIPAILCPSLSADSPVDPSKNFVVTMTVTNPGGTTANNVTPSTLTVTTLTGNASATKVSGPNPASANINPDSGQNFEWTYTASGLGGGTLQLSGSADSYDMATSNVVTVNSPHTSTVSYTTSLTCPPIRYTNVYTVKNDPNSADNIKQFIFIRPATEQELMNVVSVTAPTGWTGSFDTSTAIVTFTTSGSGISPGNSVSGFKVEYIGTAFESHGVNTFDSTGDSYHAIAQRYGGIPAVLCPSLYAPSDVVTGKNFVVTMSVTNPGGATANNVTPSTLTVTTLTGNASATKVSGPNPASANINPDSGQNFEWTYTASGLGKFELSGFANGTKSETFTVNIVKCISSLLDCPDYCSGNWRYYAGFCSGGSCNYSSQYCDHGCSNASCNPDPCAGVTCPNKCFDNFRAWNGYCDGGGQCVYNNNENCDIYDGLYCVGSTSELRGYYCSGGSCTYSVAGSYYCPYGCSGGSCNPDPCAGVSCSDKCVGDRRYYAGNCWNGSCNYDYSQPCDYGCSNGSCNTPPTLVDLIYFKATPSSNTVTLEWQTDMEIDNAGFNIWRSLQENGEYKKINEELIPAEGSGTTYTFTDTDVAVAKTYYYKLEDIDLHGVGTFHDPVSATINGIALVSPENGAIIPLKTPVTFTWGSIGFNKFKLEFSNSPDFTSKVITLPKKEWITDNFYTPAKWEWMWTYIKSFSWNGKTVYWRVYGEDEAGNGFTSEVYDFKIQLNGRR